MNGRIFQRFSCVVIALVLGSWVLPVVAQTPETDAGVPDGRGVVVMPTQRDLVAASNADAFLFGDHPHVDIVVQTADLSCFRLDDFREYGERRDVTLTLTWCLNAQNGLVTAISTSTVWGFGAQVEIVVQGAFCGWSLTMGEPEIDEIMCRTLIQEGPCGPATGG